MNAPAASQGCGRCLLLDVVLGTLALRTVWMLATCPDAVSAVQAAIQESVANIKMGSAIKA